MLRSKGMLSPNQDLFMDNVVEESAFPISHTEYLPFESHTGELIRFPSQGPSNVNVTTDSTEEARLREEDIVYKEKYRNMKRKFYNAVAKHEYLKNELKNCQQKLVTIEEDKYFLCERMLLYEKVSLNPIKSDNSDSDTGQPASLDTKPGTSGHGGITFSSAFSKIKSRSAGRRRNKAARALKSGPEDISSSAAASLSGFEEDLMRTSQSNFSSTSFNLSDRESD